MKSLILSPLESKLRKSAFANSQTQNFGFTHACGINKEVYPFLFV